MNLDALVEGDPAASAVFNEIEPNLLAGMRSRVSGALLLNHYNHYIDISLERFECKFPYLKSINDEG
jgi:hypothetical protein